VARVKTPRQRRLEKLLTERFPLPASVQLQEHDGIFGVITSSQFAGVETIDRQNLIGDIVATHLTTAESQKVLVIVGVTPDEGTGYLAGEG
jgi:stress-induced morphogen